MDTFFILLLLLGEWSVLERKKKAFPGCEKDELHPAERQGLYWESVLKIIEKCVEISISVTAEWKEETSHSIEKSPITLKSPFYQD